MYTVYVLRSMSSGNFYIGQSGNFELRLERHQQGIARYTHGRGPWEVVYLEDFTTRGGAMAREKYLKSGQGREWLKHKLNGRAGPP